MVWPIILLALPPHTCTHSTNLCGLLSMLTSFENSLPQVCVMKSNYRKAKACSALTAQEQQRDFLSFCRHQEALKPSAVTCRGRNLKVALLTLIALASSITFSHCQAERQLENPRGLHFSLNAAFIVIVVHCFFLYWNKCIQFNSRVV